MKAQTPINIETLIPSSLFDEEHSDNESFSNCKFEEHLPLCKDNSKEKLTEKINPADNSENNNSSQYSNKESNNSQKINNFNEMKMPPKEEAAFIPSLDLNAFFQPKNYKENELNFQQKLLLLQNSVNRNGTNGINEKNDIKLNNEFKNINGKNNLNGINGSSRFNFNDIKIDGLKNNIDILNNLNLLNINIVNPSLLNMNKMNGNNDIFSNQNHLINIKNDYNNINNINNFINNNISTFSNINNIKNINSNNNINNVIFTNNFTNFNISSLDENKIQMLKNINKNNINMFNFNINDINKIREFNENHYNNGLKNEKINNFNNIYIYNNINKIKKENFIDIDPNTFVTLKDLENQNNINNNAKFFMDRKKNNKKKSSLFQNETNKEKDIHDFKRFCEGIKSPLSDYICSQIGSRIMQKYLNRFPPFIITNLIEKINIYFEKIMCDIYGNYFCQKLYSICSIEQRRMILNSMKDIFINVSENPSGAHVVQSIIELADTKEEKDIIMDYIKDHEMGLSLHKEGTHVLQKIIQIFSEKERQTLTDVLCTSENVNTLCQDIKGISVIKRLISFNKEKINRIKLVEAFFPNILEISKSSSGSYIIQYLIEQWGIEIGLKIIHFCILNFEAFAINKHSSNLINKILLICLKRNSVIRSFNNANNINIMNCNEIIIINALKGILLEPNKVINVYKNKYGKALVLKIRKLFTLEENKKLYLLIKSLENSPNFLESKKYKIYIEIFESQ